MTTLPLHLAFIQNIGMTEWIIILIIMPDDANMPPAGDEPETTDSPQEESTEGYSIPLEAFNGREVKPGDVERVKVLSVDAENGTAMVECVKPKAVSGIDEAASKYDQQPMEGMPPEQS